jgi:hypothetical protein
MRSDYVKRLWLRLTLVLVATAAAPSWGSWYVEESKRKVLITEGVVAALYLAI